MDVHTEPSPCARQISGCGPKGEYILSVLAKRTYRLDRSGLRALAAAEQVPLVDDAVLDPDDPAILIDDLDLYPWKPLTDVVLKGHAYPQQRPSGQFMSAMAVGPATKRVAVFGPRRGELSSRGIAFSTPEKVEKVALSYTKAYGGRDAIAEARHGTPLGELQPYLQGVDLSAASPYLYPRNPAGVGYLIDADREAIERLVLPSLEDPDDLLTPARLCSGAPERWAAMPLPWTTGWMHLNCFPRSAFFGGIPEIDPATLPLPEIRRGLAPQDLIRPGSIFDQFNIRAANGASLGLQIPYLKPDTEFLLLGFHPAHHELRFRLPGEAPQIWIDGRNGKLVETRPVIHSILIEPDEARVSVVWRGAEAALRPYATEELPRMPFKVIW
jgi:hypothetical protein